MVFDSDKRKKYFGSRRDPCAEKSILSIEPVLFVMAVSAALFFFLLTSIFVLEFSGVVEPIFKYTNLEILSLIFVSGLSILISLYAAKLAKSKERVAFAIASTFMYASLYTVVIVSPFGFYDSGLYLTPAIMIFATLFVREKNIKWVSAASCGVIILAAALEWLGLKEIMFSPPSTLQVVTVIISFLTIQFLLRRTLYFLRTQSQELSFQKAQILNYQTKLEGMVQSRTSDLISEKNRAVQASLAKSQFLANMSHELRTPLNAIIGYGEMVVEELDAESPSSDVVLNDVAKIVYAGQNLLGINNNVLDFSKVEANQMTLRIERINIRQIVYESITIIEPLLGRTGNTIQVSNIEPTLFAYGDHQKLKQVLINLLGNANKFTEKGSIDLSVTKLSGHVKISVADTGIGMRPEFMQQLFQPFAQAENDFSRKFEGTGLGLAISKRFIELMNGAIDVNSELGQGTTFDLYVPTDNWAMQIEAKTQARLREKI